MKLANKTRKAASIPKKLIHGKLYLLPLYYFLRLSFLAREGIEHSGSYRFADHIYRGIPKGDFLIGKMLDKLLLQLKSARSFRNRHVLATIEILNHLSHFLQEEEIHILSVPAGIPRELLAVSEKLAQNDHKLLQKTRFHAMDLDPEVLSNIKKMLKEKTLPTITLHLGDALILQQYKINPHIIVSTGLGEFLTDKEIVTFYTACYRALQKKGVFITSATAKDTFSDYLMRNLGELYTHYRSESRIRQLLQKTAFRSIQTYKDDIGLQTIVIARK